MERKVHVCGREDLEDDIQDRLNKSILKTRSTLKYHEFEYNAVDEVLMLTWHVNGFLQRKFIENFNIHKEICDLKKEYCFSFLFTSKDDSCPRRHLSMSQEM